MNIMKKTSEQKGITVIAVIVMVIIIISVICITVWALSRRDNEKINEQITNNMLSNNIIEQRDKISLDESKINLINQPLLMKYNTYKGGITYSQGITIEKGEINVNDSVIIIKPNGEQISEKIKSIGQYYYKRIEDYITIEQENVESSSASDYNIELGFYNDTIIERGDIIVSKDSPYLKNEFKAQIQLRPNSETILQVEDADFTLGSLPFDEKDYMQLEVNPIKCNMIFDEKITTLEPNNYYIVTITLPFDYIVLTDYKFTIKGNDEVILNGIIL